MLSCTESKSTRRELEITGSTAEIDEIKRRLASWRGLNEVFNSVGIVRYALTDANWSMRNHVFRLISDVEVAAVNDMFFQEATAPARKAARPRRR